MMFSICYPRLWLELKWRSCLTGNPLQLAVDPRVDFLYVVTQRASASIPLGQGNTLHAIRISKVTGKLEGDSSIELSLPPGMRPQGVAAVELQNQ